jgi:hypothetical protein
MPCLQREQGSPPEIWNELLTILAALPHCTVTPYNHARYPAGTVAVAVAEDVANGQPEAFIDGTIFALLRPDGSLELRLKPEWGEVVLQNGWGTIHPLARYLSGIVPPQSLIIYAPRTHAELDVVRRIVQAALWYARGELHGVPLPDSRW